MKTATNLVSMRLAICYTLYDSGATSGPALRERIEDYRSEDLSNRRVYDTLDAMKADGLVRHEKSNATRGRYSLTDRARDELEDHHEWASRCLDDSSGQQTFEV